MLKPRVTRMALAVDYINEYLKEKGVEFNEIADVCDKLISFEVREKPIDEFKLDKLAKEYVDNSLPLLDSDAISCFKVGYRKVLKQ